MSRRASPHPTQAELEVLNVLWRCGPATVRQVHQTLQADRRTSLTTTLKILQVMMDKALVVRRQTRPHAYAAARPQDKTQAALVADLVHRAFDGSPHQLVLRAVEDGHLSGSELAEIQQVIDTIRKRKRGES
jgi:predicted transcriptional regulator